MKKCLFILFLLSVNYLYSQQDTSAVRYFPLHVGDFYVYTHVSFFTYTTIETGGISSTAILEGKLYYLFYGPVLNGYYRYDSTSGNILRYNTNYGCSYYLHQELLDSLWSNCGNYDRFCNLQSQIQCISCGSPIVVLGYNTQKRAYHLTTLPNHLERYYAKDIGLYYCYKETYQTTQDSYTLKGCIINGVTYGDTSLTGLNQISLESPKRYSLYNNYPNPFNPVTKIEFDIPKLSNAKIIIYDLLGRVVSTLVNEQLKPGSYETEWDGSNFASGIYFYSLVTDEFTVTKRMVLIK